MYCRASTQWQQVLRIQPGGDLTDYQTTQTATSTAGLPPSSSTRLVDRISTLEQNVQGLHGKLDSMLDLLKGNQKPSHSSSPSHSGSPTLPDGLSGLRTLLKDPKAQWKTREQQLAVELALQGDQDVIAVLPTNAGKSMVSIIPAFLEAHKTTLLVLPLRILLDDAKRKLDQMHVPYEIYLSGARELSGVQNLVLVSADCVSTPAFKHAIGVLHCRRPVVRQVIDEAHIPLLSTGFRENLEHLFEIRTLFSCQTFLLSATVPKQMIGPLTKFYCLQPDPVVLRSSFNRPELRLVWQLRVGPSSMAPLIKTFVSQYLCLQEDRAILFVRSLQEGQQLSQALQHPFYHGKLEDSKKTEIYQAWIAGETNVCIATSAFGTGNDYPHVRLVLHIQAPFEVVNYCQEIGRAGRDGKPATCVILNSGPIAVPPTAAHDQEDLGGRQFMVDSLNKEHACIRSLLTLFLDGASVFCSERLGQEACSRCLVRKQQQVFLFSS